VSGIHRLKDPDVEYTAWAARVHGVRGFLIGLALDVSAAGVAYLVTVIGNLEWTSTYWQILGLGLCKSVIQGLVAYLVRRLLPPQVPR